MSRDREFMSTPEFENAYELEREEKKSLGPSAEQEALGALLESIGNWPVFLTFTFRPNKYEEIVQSKNGEFYRNEKVSLGRSVIRGKKRGFKGEWQSGGVVKGSPGISPGWSHDAAGKCVFSFLRRDNELKKTRWFGVIEGSKYRNCAHGHALVASAGHVNWERVDNEWQKKRGRFKVEWTQTSKGMANYLAKQYVGKSYGRSDCHFEFSKNCRTPKMDPLPTAWYMGRIFEFLCLKKGAGSNQNLAHLGRARKRLELRWKDQCVEV